MEGFIIMDKFLTKENIVIVVAVISIIVQSNYFATKLDIATLEKKMLQLKSDLQDYSDKKDDEILNRLETQYEKIMAKLERMK